MGEIVELDVNRLTDALHEAKMQQDVIDIVLRVTKKEDAKVNEDRLYHLYYCARRETTLHNAKVNSLKDDILPKIEKAVKAIRSIKGRRKNPKAILNDEVRNFYNSRNIGFPHVENIDSLSKNIKWKLIDAADCYYSMMRFYYQEELRTAKDLHRTHVQNAREARKAIQQIKDKFQTN